jgi:DNA-binding GntR family transcriptional regulator
MVTAEDPCVKGFIELKFQSAYILVVMTDTALLARDEEGHARSARPLAEQAYERIRDDIVYLRIEPGEPLDDKLLSAQLGMSLTPVRDALKRLTLERMVVTYPRRGTFVAEITVSDEQWLTEIRQNLESVAAALAAERATQAERDHLVELAAQLDTDRSNRVTSEYHALDAAIHKAIYAAAHNPYLEASLTQYLNLTLRIWHYGLRRVPSQHSAGRDQHDVVAAIARGDADAAAQAARAHLGDYSEAVRSLLAK